jgi:protein-S-isoprenylcysteine O-methyltransferase Ste14
MGLDIRWPIGLMFSLIGLILVVFGLISGGSDIYKASLGINVNLYWGLLLLVFGGWMLSMAWRGSKRDQAARTEAETGRKK